MARIEVWPIPQPGFGNETTIGRKCNDDLPLEGESGLGVQKGQRSLLMNIDPGQSEQNQGSKSTCKG